MRKTVYLILALFLLFSGVTLFADESEYYYTNVPVLKVYPHRLGYMVVYKKGSTELREAYLPMEWFTPGGKAQIVAARGTAYPYLSVFYKSGVFDHVRLFVQDNMYHESWAVFAQDANVDSNFKGVEELKIEY